MGDSRKDSKNARKFIDEQIKANVVKLEDAEARLKAFKLRNLELQNVEGLDMTEQMSVVVNQLSQARLELREAENARDTAKRQLNNEKLQAQDQTMNSLLQESSLSISTPEIDGRIDVQRRNLDGLLQRFTEQHPDVVNTRRLIKELTEVKKREVLGLRKMALENPSTQSNSSLMQQELNRIVATTEVQAATLKTRVAEYASRLNRARELMKTAPQIESEQAQLNRDYDINKKNYNDLVTRRESAALTGDLENVAGLADFRLIDPPRASQKPVAPNRYLLMPIALVVALGLGFLASFLASQMRAVFYDARSLSQVLGLPLLGTVSLVMREHEIVNEKKELRLFLIASSGLVIVFLAGMLVLSFLSEGAK
jgi:polysaccharide chain length determinant protein (PEP-CTERM system associated)